MAGLKANRTKIRRERLMREAGDDLAALLAIEKRLGLHAAALVALDARISRLELLRLEKQDARLKAANLGLAGLKSPLKPG